MARWLEDIREGRPATPWIAMQTMRGRTSVQQVAEMGSPMPTEINPRVLVRRAKSLHVMAQILAREAGDLAEAVVDWNHGDNARINAERERKSGPTPGCVAEELHACEEEADPEAPDAPSGRW